MVTLIIFSALCATVLSTVNHVQCRDVSYVASRRPEVPPTYLLPLGGMRHLGTPVALRVKSPRSKVVPLFMSRKCLQQSPQDTQDEKREKRSPILVTAATSVAPEQKHSSCLSTFDSLGVQSPWACVVT